MIRIHLEIPSNDPQDTPRLYKLPGVMDAAQKILDKPDHVVKFYLRLDNGFPEIIAQAEPQDVAH